jgi:hypothetical protein
MKPCNLEELLELLKIMAQFEISISILYKLCSGKWREDADFWLSINKDEIKHSENVKKMADILKKRIGSGAIFKYNRPFTINSVQNAINNVMQTIERVKKEELSPQKILSIAWDIENSALERKYSEIVKTDDIEYQTLSATIDEETQMHRNKIEAKLKGYNNK